MLEMEFPFSPIIIPLFCFPKMLTCESAYTNTVKDFLIIFKDFRNYDFHVLAARVHCHAGNKKKTKLPIKRVANSTGDCSCHAVRHI